MSALLKIGGLAGLGMAIIIYALTTLPRSPSPVTSPASNPAAQIAPAYSPLPHPGKIAMRSLPAVITPTPQARIRAVAIPPTPPPLVATAFSGLPAVVTPAAAGGPLSPSPVLLRLPRMPTGPLPGILRLPATGGPFPAVILLHGCGGPFTAMPDWAIRLNDWGYAVLMPDSMAPRGIRNVCDPADQPKVTPFDRVGDIGASATWLRTQPEIDPARIGVLGLSHGGATAALAVQSPYAAMRLRAALDYYGPCFEPQLHGAVPLLVLAGEADDWGDPAKRCRAYGSELRPGQPFEIHTYPDVYHGFDGGPVNKKTYQGHILQYDRAAAEDSFIRVRTFLDRQLRR